MLFRCSTDSGDEKLMDRGVFLVVCDGEIDGRKGAVQLRSGGSNKLNSY
jgi:hypothetical protein